MKINNEKIVLLFLILHPLLDVLATVLPHLYLHIIVRGIFLLYCGVYLLKNSKTRKITVLLGLSMLVFLVYHYYILTFPLFSVCNSIFKFYYLFFIILFFSINKIDDIGKYLGIVLIEYIGIYLCSYIFGFGYSAYLETDGKTGFRGVFQSINELSAIMVILYYFVLHYYQKNYLIVILFTILLAIVTYLAGTKVLFGGMVILLFGFILNKILPYIKKWNIKKKCLFAGGLIVVFSLVAYLFTKTNAYQNMLVQAEFFKVSNFLTPNGINRIIFNNRLTFLELNFKHFINENIFSKILGIGYFNPLKLIEIDCFDLLFRFGFFGLGIFILMIGYLIKMVRKNIWSIVGIVLLLLISCTSGHVLFSPAVSIYFGILIFFSVRETQKK